MAKKGSFHQSEQAQDTFYKLKEAMRTFLILALLDFTQPFILECDASGEGIGTELIHDQ